MLTEQEVTNTRRVIKAASYFNTQNDDVRVYAVAYLANRALELYLNDNKPQRDSLAAAVRALVSDAMLRMPDMSLWPLHLERPE